jgi:formate-dependent nitrite reductase membrane component NrfD
MDTTPWGAPLAVYFTLIGLPSGLTLLLWWHHSRGEDTSTVVGWRAHWVVLALLSGAGLLLVADLGRPERFPLMLTRFGNWDSPISLGAKLIAVKSFLVAVALYLMWRRRRAERAAGRPLAPGGTARRTQRATHWALGILSVALAVYPVAVLSRTWIAPLATTSGAALIYLLTALLMGCAALQLLLALPPARQAVPALPAGSASSPAAGPGTASPGLRELTLALLAAYAAVLLFAGVSVPAGPAAAALDSLLDGDFAPLFYGGVLGAGIVLPLVVLSLAGHRRWAQLTSAGAILSGTGAVRYLIFAA